MHRISQEVFVQSVYLKMLTAAAFMEEILYHVNTKHIRTGNIPFYTFTIPSIHSFDYCHNISDLATWR